MEQIENMNAAPHAAGRNPLPGPRGLPLLGNAHQFPPRRAHRVLEAWARRYGPLFTFRLGPRRIVGVADAALIAQMLRQRPERYKRMAPIREIFHEAGIPGVFPDEGETWRRQRRIWNQALSLHRIKPFFDRIVTVSDRLRQRWTDAAGDLQMVEELMRFTVDVTTLFAFGHDGDTIRCDGDVVQDHLQHVFPALNARMLSPVAYWHWFRLPRDRRLDTAIARIRAFVQEHIDEARKGLDADPAREQQPANLLEALIAAGRQSGESLSDEEIFGNTIGALLAGEDTTAYTIAWMIHELMHHPAARERLRAEIDAAVDSRGLLPDLATAARLPYLDAVMNETLRLRPVAPFIALSSLVDVELAGHHFPPGTDFLAAARIGALDPAQFEDPTRFRPERWLELPSGEALRRSPTPFGGGRRSCPGRSLAQLEIRAVIAMLLANFEFEPADPDQLVREEMKFTMGPQGLRVRLTPRA